MYVFEEKTFLQKSILDNDMDNDSLSKIDIYNNFVFFLLPYKKSCRHSYIFLSNFYLDSVAIMNIIAIEIELNIYNIIYIINELF